MHKFNCHDRYLLVTRSPWFPKISHESLCIHFHTIIHSRRWVYIVMYEYGNGNHEDSSIQASEPIMSWKLQKLIHSRIATSHYKRVSMCAWMFVCIYIICSECIFCIWNLGLHHGLSCQITKFPLYIVIVFACELELESFLKYSKLLHSSGCPHLHITHCPCTVTV